MSGNLPKNWIRKPSKSHNGKYFYFNTATGESQWHPPTKTMVSKLANRLNVNPVKTQKLSNDDKLRKLNPKSHEHFKTPAQDRLKTLRAIINVDGKGAKSALAIAVPTTSLVSNLNKSSNLLTEKPSNPKTNVKSNPIEVINRKRKPETSDFPIDYRVKKPKLIETYTISNSSNNNNNNSNNEKGKPTNRKSIFKTIYSHAKNFATNIFKPTKRTNETERVIDNFNFTLPTPSSPLTSATENATNFNNYESKNSFDNGGSPPAFSTNVFQSKFSANDRLAKLRNDLATNNTATVTPKSNLGYCDTKIAQNSELQKYNKIKINAATPDTSNSITTSTQSKLNNNTGNTSTDDCQFHLTSKRLLKIVVDTNVFMNNITFIESLLNGQFNVPVEVQLTVPYIVLQELDKLKLNSQNVSKPMLASQAIRFLNRKFTEKHSKLKSQNSKDDSNHLIKIENPDDRILNCCLQLKAMDKQSEIILLTNDVNLRNKALCNSLQSPSKGELKSQLGVID